jgi:hemerythrin-like metal-binding protein
MALFEWTSDYSVSVMRFDSEHKKLIALINELNEAMSAGRGRAIVARVLKELTDYTQRHFAGEEEAMRRAGYPGLDAHIAEHRALSAQVAKYYDEWAANASTSTVDLLFFLRDWLQKHIMETDRNYAKALNGAGIH